MRAGGGARRSPLAALRLPLTARSLPDAPPSPRQLLGKVTIAAGGVLPNIHSVLLPKKKGDDDDEPKKSKKQSGASQAY